MYQERVEQFANYRSSEKFGGKPLTWHCCDSWVPLPDADRTYIIHEDFDPRKIEIKSECDRETGPAGKRPNGTA